MKIAFISDNITDFIKDHDSTWSIMKAAYESGAEIYSTHISSLFIFEAKVYAQCINLDKEFFIHQNSNKSKKLVFPRKYSVHSIELDSMDLIFMRSDPPVDRAYITACHLLSLCKRARVINNLNSLINFNEKLSILNFPDLITETFVSSSKTEIKKFIMKFQKAVLKPLNGMAGSGIFVVEASDKNLNSILEISLERSSPIMVQRYIPEISQGDKRIIMINGSIVGALLRVPTDSDYRANLAAGGSFIKYELSERDKEIGFRLSNFLIDNGIYLAGIDVIGEYLTEINITSPTCLQEIDNLEGNNGAKKLASVLVQQLSPG